MDNTYYLTYVVGRRGAGKTTLLAHFACGYMIPPKSIMDLWQCKKEIQNLNAGGWKLDMPKAKHLVYVVDDIFTARDMGYLPRVSMELKFERLGLNDGVHKVDYLLPYAKIFLPEIQSKLDSRKSTTSEKASDYLLRYLERQRKVGVQMWADAQLDDSVDKRFRNLADRIIEVLGQEHEITKHGEIIKTTWHCLEFDGIFAYHRYKSTGNIAEAKQTTYTHNGNIFQCVNSFSGKEYFYDGIKQFHTTLAKPTTNDKKAMTERVKKFPLFQKKEQSNGYTEIEF
jgi:hypothetical protein